MPNPLTKNWRSLLTIGLSSLVLLIILVGLVFGLAAGCSLDTNKLEEQKLSSVVYGANDKIVTVLYQENRDYITLDKVPQNLKNAFIAIEDSKFYEHRGIDPFGIARALLLDLKVGGKAQGASTITQQLARATFLTNEKSWLRKIREAGYAIAMERTYTKDQIFEMYLNKVFFGRRSFGVQAASRAYLGKDVWNLNLAESALVAGLVKAPSAYMNNPEKAKTRRDIVLYRMAEVGYITQQQKEAAQKEPLRFIESSGTQRVAPYFLDYVVQELAKHGIDERTIFTGGLQIKTTLDVDAQKAAEEAFTNSLPAASPDEQGIAQPQAAMIAIDPHTGYIKAMIGGRDFGNTQLNRAVSAHRQIGSSVKPFVYTAAIDNQFTAASVMVDEPIEFPKGDGTMYKPQNYDRKFRGPLTLREAIEGSINTVAVQLVDQLGPQTVFKYAQRMGLDSLVSSGTRNDMNLASLALGGLTRGVTPLEMARAYSPLANQGIRVEPLAVLEVRDRSGQVLYRNHTTRTVVLSEQTAYVVTDMMRGVIERGTGRSANIGRPAAGKTGTTNDNTNVWFAGFTPDLLAVVWIGNDVQSKRLVVNGSVIGSSTPARIWARFMGGALSRTPVSDFPVPQGVSTSVEICAESGYLASPNCPNTRMETFIAGTEPAEECPLHGPGGESRYETVRVCTQTGKVATDGCPTEQVITKYFDRVTGREVHDGSVRPWEPCNVHGSTEITVKICTESGLLATPFCPKEAVISQRFIQGEQPTQNCDIHGPLQH